MFSIRAWMYLSIAAISVIYCEFLADFIALQRCQWPVHTEKTLRALILADTHLLGPLHGHWLDKLYREWHMKGAFQAAILIFRPDVVFVLGDLFDEGDKVDNKQFKDYVERFYSHFRTPAGIPIVSAVGNHDVGFHYKMRPFFTERFEKIYNNTGAQMYTFKETHFVFVNSMSLENDGCYFCETALHDLSRVSATLNCLKAPEECTDKQAVLVHKQYSRPILMQHFPTYRVSDNVCKEHDAPLIHKFRENWDVLSKDATDLLEKLLQPRLAFAGHSHHYCRNINRFGVEEYTVASFNWRNKVHPSFLLASLTASTHAVTKCNMLNQQLVYNIYIVASVACILLVLIHVHQIYLKRRTDTIFHKLAKCS